MSRTLFRVPMDFNWPSVEPWFGYNRPIPCPFCKKTGKRHGTSDENCDICKGHGCLFEYIEPPEGIGWQMWETSGEDGPMSPVFATPEELARWLPESEASAIAGDTTTYEEWLAMITKPDTDDRYVVILPTNAGGEHITWKQARQNNSQRAVGDQAATSPQPFDNKDGSLRMGMSGAMFELLAQAGIARIKVVYDATQKLEHATTIEGFDANGQTMDVPSEELVYLLKMVGAQLSQIGAKLRKGLCGELLFDTNESTVTCRYPPISEYSPEHAAKWKEWVAYTDEEEQERRKEQQEANEIADRILGWRRPQRQRGSDTEGNAAEAGKPIDESEGSDAQR